MLFTSEIWDKFTEFFFEIFKNSEIFPVLKFQKMNEINLSQTSRL